MNLEQRKYYQELAVQPDASQEEIRDAYRKLAKKYHPDLNRGDPRAEEKFKRVNEAYHHLIDSRVSISMTAQTPPPHPRSRTRKSSSTKKSQTEKGAFTDFFKKVFTGETKKTPPKSAFKHSSYARAKEDGKDLQISLELDMIELLEGVKKEVLISRERTCQTCGGNGIKPGHKPIQCKICLGIGEVPTSENGKTVFVICPNCHGTGKIIKERCVNCGGKGIIFGKSQVTIQVPPKSKPGQILSIKGLGNVGKGGGKDGNLRVHLKEKANPYFQSDGYNLVYDYPLNLLEIVQGGELEIPTISGRVKLHLEPGMEPNRTLRVKDKGLNKPGGGQGDLLVRIQYHFPDKVSKKALSLIEELVSLPGWKPRKDKKGFYRQRGN